MQNLIAQQYDRLILHYSSCFLFPNAIYSIQIPSKDTALQSQPTQLKPTVDPDRIFLQWDWLTLSSSCFCEAADWCLRHCSNDSSLSLFDSSSSDLRRCWASICSQTHTSMSTPSPQGYCTPGKKQNTLNWHCNNASWTQKHWTFQTTCAIMD